MLPSRVPEHQGFPQPAGTGFFVSPAGWFVTAAHVLMDNNGLRSDAEQLLLDKEIGDDGMPSGAHGATVSFCDPGSDLAILKFDFAENSDKAFLKDGDGFPYVSLSDRVLDEAEPVFAFGYPLGQAFVANSEGQQFFVGHIAHSPRTTSAIVASRVEATQMLTVHGAPPAVYVLDKALNYGNSGGTDCFRRHGTRPRILCTVPAGPHPPAPFSG